MSTTPRPVHPPRRLAPTGSDRGHTEHHTVADLANLRSSFPPAVFEVTVMTIHSDIPTHGQIEQLKTEGWLKPGATAWYNAGIYVFTPLLFEFTARLQKSPRGEYELTDALNALVAAGKRIAGMQIAGRWVDVRDPEVLASLEKGDPKLDNSTSPRTKP